MFSSVKDRSKSFWISLVLFFAVCFGYFINVLFKTDFHYTYLLDDAYIHLAMAKNFALHQVWGVTSHQFSSSSSSPLYTLLISILIKIFGNNDQIPLYFNAVFGLGIIFFLNRFFSDIFNDVKNVVLATLFTLFFAVSHLLLLSGMEHLLHVFLVVLNVYCLKNLDKNKFFVAGFYISIMLMGLARFESMFYFVILAFVFILIKKWKEAFAILFFGFLPIAVFCYFNYLQDGYLFPNSVVVKGTKLVFDSTFLSQVFNIFINKLLLNVSFYKVGIFPLLMCFVFVFKDFRAIGFSKALRENYLLVVFSLVMICHSLFADLKGAFRYEAYILVGFSMVLIPKLTAFFKDFKTYIKKEKLMSFLILMNVVLMIYKFGFSHIMLNNGGKNIYEQQVQSAQFLHTYYNESKVVANDIGAITYYTDIHLLDIVGLGSSEMIPYNTTNKKFDYHFEDFLAEYCQNNNFELAIVYEDWLDGHVPKNWKKVAVLKIENNVTTYGKDVSIYSLNKNHQELLKNNVKKFNWNKNVKVEMMK